MKSQHQSTITSSNMKHQCVPVKPQSPSPCRAGQDENPRKPSCGRPKPANRHAPKDAAYPISQRTASPSSCSSRHLLSNLVADPSNNGLSASPCQDSTSSAIPSPLKIVISPCTRKAAPNRSPRLSAGSAPLWTPVPCHPMPSPPVVLRLTQTPLGPPSSHPINFPHRVRTFLFALFTSLVAHVAR